MVVVVEHLGKCGVPCRDWILHGVEGFQTEEAIHHGEGAKLVAGVVGGGADSIGGWNVGHGDTAAVQAEGKVRVGTSGHDKGVG